MLFSFIPLFTAHLLADFVFQSDWMVHRKTQLIPLLLHIVIVISVAILFCGGLPFWAILILGITHAGFDFSKNYFSNQFVWLARLPGFLLDQIGHILVLVMIAMLYPNALNFGFWADYDVQYIIVFMAICSGVLMVMPASKYMFQLVFQLLDIKNSREERLRLKSGLIGGIEAMLILFFVLIGHFANLFALLSLKFLYRYPLLIDKANPTLMRYIIVGTALNFAWAISVAFFVRAMIQHIN